MMIYKLALAIIVLNLFFEFLENLFPIKNMNKSVVSAGKLIMLYFVCKLVFDLIKNAKSI